MNRKLVGLAIIGAMLLIAPIGRAAEEKPDATVKMTGKALSAGVGYSWGSGTLTYQGKEYPFSISGLSAGNIGASSAELSGEVFNLKDFADFNGNYTSFAAGITVAGEIGRASWREQKGITMNVAGTTREVR